MNQELLYDIDQVIPLAIETGLFVSLFTATKPPGTMTASGFPTGAYVPVDGLVDLLCMDPPESDARIVADEAKTQKDFTAFERHHVLIAGYYSALDAGWRGDDAAGTGGWRADIGDNDGAGNPVNVVTYDILGVEFDSQRQMTRVKVQLATV